MKQRIESFEDLDVYRLAEDLGDRIWDIVLRWSDFPKNTLGYQLVKAADSIGANIAEGFGRFHFAENRQFARISRGSLYETRHWLRRAYKRGLLKEEEINEMRNLLEELAPRLNAYISAIGKQESRGKRATHDSHEIAGSLQAGKERIVEKIKKKLEKWRETHSTPGRAGQASAP
jgi:four helix bundle protein